MSFQESIIIPQSYYATLSGGKQKIKKPVGEKSVRLAKSATAYSSLVKYQRHRGKYASKPAVAQPGLISSPKDSGQKFNDIFKYFDIDEHHKIFSFLSSVEKKLPNQLKWEQNTYRLIIRGEVIPDSNLIDAIKFMLGSTSKSVTHYKLTDPETVDGLNQAGQDEFNASTVPRGIYEIYDLLFDLLPAGAERDDIVEYFPFVSEYTYGVARRFQANFINPKKERVQEEIDERLRTEQQFKQEAAEAALQAARADDARILAENEAQRRLLARRAKRRKALADLKSVRGLDELPFAPRGASVAEQIGLLSPDVRLTNLTPEDIERLNTPSKRSLSGALSSPGKKVLRLTPYHRRRRPSRKPDKYSPSQYR